MSVLAFQGSVAQLPDGSPVRVFDDRVRCSPRPEERVIVLSADAPFSVALDGLTRVNALSLEADHPVTVLLTSTAGSAQALPAEMLQIVTRSVPITGISLVRVAGQTTTVRLILGQEAQ